MRSLVRALLALLVVLTVGVLGSSVGRAAAADGDGLSGPTTLVGAPGLSWSDIDPDVTPALWRLASEGAVGSLTVRAVRSRSCAVDGWLTLSAGRRAADLPGPCAEPGPAVDGVVPRWDDYVTAARADSYDAVPGTLAARLADVGACVAVVGAGAAVGGATPDGRVEAAASAADSSCEVTLVDGGALPADDDARREALRALDRTVADVVAQGSDRTTVVAGIADGGTPVRPRAVLAAGPDIDVGLLTSASTRQLGLVQLQDLTATLLAWNGASDRGLTGRPVSAEVDDGVDVVDRADALAGFETRAGTLRAVAPQVTGWLAAAFAAWCLAAALLSWRGRWDAPSARRLRVTGVAVAAVPVATFAANLVPWWFAGRPALVFTAVLAVVVVAVSALAWAAERRRPLGALLVVAVLTLLVLGGDVLTGSGLQLASVFGQNPTVGGRFYGLGNTSYALYGVATMAVVAIVATSRRGSLRHTLGLPALLLIALTALEAHPSLGADFGGPPGLVLGGLVVLAGATSVRLTVGRVVGAVAAVVVLTAGVAVLDWLRPAEARTHLGEFVQTVLDGGVDDVLGRKLAQNLTNLTSPPLVTIAVAALVLGLVAWRTGWRPSRPGSLVLRGSAVLAVVGFGVNDSGLVIPAFVALVLLPLLAAETPAEDPPLR